MDTVNTLIGAAGLAFAAGLNAYIPLFLIGLAARFLPADMVVLSPAFRFLSQDWCLILLAILLTIEFLADKIPVVDHMNDLVQTLIRPTAGAVLFAAGTGTVEHLDPRLAMALGFLAAGSVHAMKMVFRPVVTTTTAGIGNPVISLLEDALSFVLSLLAILFPVLVLLVLVLLPLLIIRWVMKWRREPEPRP